MNHSARTREVIVGEIATLLAEDGKPQQASMTDDAVLLEAGLDSLGYAVLVTRLEDSLGCDPFTEMSQPVYPRTLGQFVEVYAACVPES